MLTLGQDLATRIATSLAKGGDQTTPSLRLSNIGTPCDRKLWYMINKPELAEPLSPSTKLKFLFGDILEELLLWLAEQSGHTVTDKQKEVEVNGVKGHIDALIDTHLVDVKSASSRSFDKFKYGLNASNDTFGYLHQLGAYSHAIGAKVLAFLAVDKQFGHICLDTHEKDDTDYPKLVEKKKYIVSLPDPPKRTFSDVPEGKSGNRKLCTECSYCPFKQSCFPGLRTFVYSTGPVYLTHVAREPLVPEYKNEV